MREPIVYFGIGFLLAALLLFGAYTLARSPFRRLAVKGENPAASDPIADIEADMGELHAQIAMATHRLETSVQHMKAKTKSQLAQIGTTSEGIARLNAEFAERSAALQTVSEKEKSLHEQLRIADAELVVKGEALTEVERKLAQEKASLQELMAITHARDKLAETERRYCERLEILRAENRSLEEELGESFHERTRLEHEITDLRRQIETTWATERMANAVLRERINDVALEVVRVAQALEGLAVPMDTLLAGRASELAGLLSGPGVEDENRPAPSLSSGGESKGALARRIRSLQQRAARVASADST
jgi:chromosome segregation ATPase